MAEHRELQTGRSDDAGEQQQRRLGLCGAETTVKVYVPAGKSPGSTVTTASMVASDYTDLTVALPQGGI